MAPATKKRGGDYFQALRFLSIPPSAPLLFTILLHRVRRNEAFGKANHAAPAIKPSRQVLQEGAPSLPWRPPPSSDRVLSDARLRDLKPEFEQFAVDAGRSPKRILHTHLPVRTENLNPNIVVMKSAKDRV
jgi:hypothetical protein